jgi:hypothetical protein
MSTLTDRRAGLSSSIAIKAGVRLATTAAITRSGYQTIDGVLPTSADHPDLRRILVKDQSDAAENGIFTMDVGTWVRTKDFDGINDIRKGTLVYVNEGTTGSGACFRVTSSIDPDDFTIDEDDIAFGAGNITTVSSPTDGAFLVGNGSAWVGESGATARTSIGLGASDSVTFDGLTLTGTLTATLNTATVHQITSEGTGYVKFFKNHTAATGDDQVVNISAFFDGNMGAVGTQGTSLNVYAGTGFNATATGNTHGVSVINEIRNCARFGSTFMEAAAEFNWLGAQWLDSLGGSTPTTYTNDNMGLWSAPSRVAGPITERAQDTRAIQS